MPSSAPTVMMPVPPTPATTIEYGRSSAGSVGLGQLREQVVGGRQRLCRAAGVRLRR